MLYCDLRQYPAELRKPARKQGRYTQAKVNVSPSLTVGLLQRPLALQDSTILTVQRPYEQPLVSEVIAQETKVKYDLRVSFA